MMMLEFKRAIILHLDTVGRMVASVFERSRKVRAPEGALPGNAWAMSKDIDG